MTTLAETSWTPDGVVLVIGALVTLVTAIGAAATAVAVAMRALNKASEATASAAGATGMAHASQQSISRLSERSNEQARAINTLALNATPTADSVVVPTPVATQQKRRIKMPDGKVYEGVLTEVHDEGHSPK